MSNIQTGAERMPHDLSHLGFLAGQIGRLITISTTPVIAGDSFEMDAVGALRLSPFLRVLVIGLLFPFQPLRFSLGASSGLTAFAVFLFFHCLVGFLFNFILTFFLFYFLIGTFFGNS